MNRKADGKIPEDRITKEEIARERARQHYYNHHDEILEKLRKKRQTPEYKRKRHEYYLRNKDKWKKYRCGKTKKERASVQRFYDPFLANDNQGCK